MPPFARTDRVRSIRAATWGVLLAVAISLTILWMPTPEGMPLLAQRAASVSALMALLWIVVPDQIPVVSLFPIALYPLFGILTAKETCVAYGTSNVFLYLGGFILALAIERQHLHKRIALMIISRIGSRPRQLVFGFLLATAFLSMWISNTATTLLMLPIALALLDTLTDSLAQREGVSHSDAEATLRPVSIAMLLGVAYAASCGGFATMVGTPTNPVLRGFWEKKYVPLGLPPISSAHWMLVCVPLSLLMLMAVGFVMTRRIPALPSIEPIGRTFFRERLAEIGPMKPGERRVFVVFLITAALWILSQTFELGSRVIWSWPQMLEQLCLWCGMDSTHMPRGLDESTVAIAMAAVLFILPGDRTAAGASTRLAEWNDVEKKIPWGILLLFGGGFAMANAFESTGLSKWLGESFAHRMEHVPLWVLVTGTCAMVTALTEFTSNVACITTLLPVLAGTADQLGVDPRLILIPATIAASCGFMMPAGTPPNAIVMGTGRVPIRAMMGYGFFLNLIGIVFVSLFTFWVLVPVLGIQITSR